MISFGSPTSNNSNVILRLVKKKSFIYLVLHNLYTQPGAHTHDPEIKGCILHGLRHPGIPPSSAVLKPTSQKPNDVA